MQKFKQSSEINSAILVKFSIIITGRIIQFYWIIALFNEGKKIQTTDERLYFIHRGFARDGKYSYIYL